MDTHRLITALFVLSGCTASVTSAEVEGSELALERRLPDALTVPAGQRFEFALIGRGVQIYQCKTAPSGNHAWTLVAPDAKLFDRRGHAAGTHYAGPTWEALDGSKVVAKKIAEAPGAEDSIPWLLLQAESHAGSGRMDAVTYIQRLNTDAGRPPTAACTAGNDGERREVAYSALYAFYRPRS